VTEHDDYENEIRQLTDDLRTRGMPVAEAVTDAARQLREPRKHVGSAFGAPISTARSWGVVALLVPMLVFGMISVYEYVGLWNRYTLEMMFEIALCVALVKKMGWARPLLLAPALFGSVMSMAFAWTVDDYSPLYFVWNIGLLALLMPWRKDELTGPGLALASYAWAYGVATWALSFQVTSPDGVDLYFVPSGAIACIAIGVATLGTLLRARWSSIAGVVAAAALGIALVEMAGIEFLFADALVMEIAMLGSLVTGMVAALAGAALAWRGANKKPPIGSRSPETPFATGSGKETLPIGSQSPKTPFATGSGVEAN
jgi:hypothetical protein